MSKVRWLTIAVIVFLAMPLTYVIYVSLVAPREGDRPEGGRTEAEFLLSPEEEVRIQSWIQKERLNEYGDPADTVYVGGTPLFDERTGESYSRFEYIILNHPDRPWNTE